MSEGRFTRYDAGQATFTPTPSGGLRGPANLTRIGVFSYRNPDGTIRRELRHPDDVFHADSIASLEDAPLTAGHPKEGMVTPENYQRLSIGHVRNPRVDAKFLAGIAVVQTARNIGAIRAKNEGDLSCGYTCKLVAESGDFQGERYDARQTEIRYNHVALLPPGTGRAGAEVRLRIDGNEEASCAETEVPATSEAMDPKEIAKLMNDTSAALSRADAAEKRATEAEGKAKAEAVRADKAEADRDTAKEAAKKAEDALKSERDSFSARVDSRVHVIAQAAKILPKEFVFSGKTDREIQVEALKVAIPKFDAKDRSDEYISARFDGLSEQESAASGASGLRVKPEPKHVKKASERADEEDAEPEIPAWQKPLAASRV